MAAGPFSAMTEFLSSVGFFTYLAYFLLLILLYYLFRHLIGKYAESGLERLQKKTSNVKKKLIYRIIGLIVAFICFVFLSFLGTFVAAIIVLVVGAIVLFILYVADTRMLSVILSVVVTVASYFMFASFADTAAAFITTVVFVLAIIIVLVAAVVKLAGVDVLSFFQK